MPIISSLFLTARRTVNANVGVVLQAQVNVFLDAKAKVASLAKVGALQFVFLDLRTRMSLIFFTNARIMGEE